MNDHAPLPEPGKDEIHRLATRALGEDISDAEARRLEALIVDNPQARRSYVEFICDASNIRLLVARGRREGRTRQEAVAGREDGGIESRNAEAPSPGLPLLTSEPPIPPIILDLSSPLRPSPGLFAPGGWLFSYVVATVIVGIAVLGAWAYRVSLSHDEVADVAPRPSSPGIEPEPELAGRITGTVDCRWTGPEGAPVGSGDVPLGGRYALRCGLMEITYKSGAVVILEGPCIYDVESASGGFLSRGKLTARVETKGEGGRGKAEEGRGQKSEVRGQESPFPLPPSAFVVRTPTAVVTDLGTEFGVEVAENGNTASYVFRGSVRVQVAIGTSQQGPHPVVLRENESARVERGQQGDAPRLVWHGVAGNSSGYVRHLFPPLKQLDLLDIVAGDNGAGHRREHGIDPVSGGYEPLFVPQHRSGGHRYAPTTWHRLIDGVFVPDGGAGPVQLDSAGHTFGGFPKTSDETYGSLWSRAADIAPENSVQGQQHWVYVLGRDARFMPEGRGLLCMHGNQAITFNLEAMRKMYARLRPSRFRAVAGLGDAHSVDPNADGMADFWVFVDGRLKLKRMHVRPQDGVFKVDVELGAGDRFLTLAVTDGGNTEAADWAVFGDPVLEMAPIGPDQRK